MSMGQLTVGVSRPLAYTTLYRLLLAIACRHTGVLLASPPLMRGPRRCTTTFAHFLRWGDTMPHTIWVHIRYARTSDLTRAPHHHRALPVSLPSGVAGFFHHCLPHRTSVPPGSNRLPARSVPLP